MNFFFDYPIEGLPASSSGTYATKKSYRDLGH